MNAKKIISCILVLFVFLSIFLVFWFRITLFPKYFKSEEKITPTIHNAIVTNVKDEPAINKEEVKETKTSEEESKDDSI
ncbi:MAG: hypothetical protein Q2306_02360 [Phytoplasma sp.]|uniref:hypothetical protein n=1 Tax=Phytoplasma sp. TaxID=2155 RepID=UPI002B412A21|nr:hypothetical protein [Phytoplasma sp.]WRH06712.1 MAG: hypothetical protein Q2306_02360 [Phytoplasma sp.]